MTFRSKRLAMVLAATLMAVSAASQQRPPVLPGPVPTPATAAPEAKRPDTTPTLSASDLGAWLDGFMPTTLKQGKIAGAQVVVVKDGQILAKKGYGYADVAAKTPMDPDRTLMRIGSTSKLFAWTTVMQQVEAGKIDLNADINRYLDFKIAPKGGRPITMNDLMRHRGGFQEGLKDVLATDPAKFKTNEQLLKDDRPPQLFPAGEVPAYSNYGTALAGYIVQRVSGEPFEAYVERHILAPLGMSRTTFRQPLPAGLKGLMSKGYRESDGPPSKFELVATVPAGGVSATGADLARFMIAHLQQGRFGSAQILRPETARLMHTPAVAAEPGFDAMAHGFFYQQRNGRLVIGHGGDTIVFHSDLNLLPAEGVGIFVSFNSRGKNDAVYGARERLFDLFMDRYFPAPPAVTPPAIRSAAEDAKSIAGRYESSRRVETGFISLFYLLQQEQVVPNDDGTISLASIEGKRFREIAPGLWRDVEGARQLRVTEVEGRRAIIDSTNPTAIVQAVPLARNALLFQLVFGLSVLILLATVLLWPISAWVRRAYGAPPATIGRARLAGRLARIAAAGDLLYLAGWYTLLAPILSTQLDGYNDELNGTIRLLQVAAIVPLAGAVVGLWNVRLVFGAARPWGARVRSVFLAAALLGLVWVAWMGGLIGWSLNY